MQTRLFEYTVQDSCLVALLWSQRGGDIEFETLGDLVLELNLTFQDVGGGPGLGESEAILAVSVFGFDVSSNHVAV